MTRHPFSQVDVFAPGPRYGNPVAVVHDADDLSTAQMQAFADWTNLSETTFLLRPTTPEADYRLRIFTPAAELPFAGHPTLGSARAWLSRGGRPRTPGRTVQQCDAGLIDIRHGDDAGELAFAAPPLRRHGPVDPVVLDALINCLGVDPTAVAASSWIDNGPGWIGLELDSADAVLDLTPDFAVMGDLRIAVIGRHPVTGPADYEVRVFAPALGINEDPVTGSAVAGFAVWKHLRGETGSYTVRQGTVLGRDGRLTITPGDPTWVGGYSEVIVTGTVAPR